MDTLTLKAIFEKSPHQRACSIFASVSLHSRVPGILPALSNQRVILSFFKGAIGAGTFIVAAGYAKTASVAVTCMCIGVAASGLMHSGYNVNMLDIAPQYACVLMGLSNTIGTFAGFLSPMMVGYITEDKVSTVNFTRMIEFCISRC